MLQTLRKGAAGWVAKVFFALLVLSFAIWGIEDVFRRIGGDSSNVAEIGDRKISVEDFRAAYTNELRRISNQAKRVITPEQARAAGLGDKVLGDLVNEAAMDAKVAQLGLTLSDEEVVKEVQDDDMFAGADGSFDRRTFNEILRQNNLTENQYLGLQRSFSARKQLTDALMANLAAPETFRQAIHAFNTDSRSITYLQLKAEEPSALPAPAPDALRKYFDERKSSFAAPEYRKLAVLSLDPKTLAGSKQIPDDKLKAYYDANQPKYANLEKRSIEQISFPSVEEAKAAYDKIQNGALFEQIMAERKLKPDDIFLGDLTKDQLFDSKIADAAFSLPQGRVSEPVQGTYATVLLRVTGVQQQQLKSFEEVKDQIRSVMAEEEARRETLALHDKIDEARLGGATLDEVAKANSLQVRQIDAVDSSGRGPDGKEIADLPMSRKLLDAAFAAEVGGQTETLSEGDGYVWYEVRGLTPPRERSFDEARAAVESRWREEQVGVRLDAKAEAILKDLRSGKSMDQVAQANKLEVEQAETTRLGGAPSITAVQAKSVFQTPVEGFGMTPTDERGGRLVFRVTAETDRPFDASKPDDSGQVEKITQSMGNDVVSALVRQLRTDLGAKIDQANVAKVTGSANAN
ncbi:SurA N-terminal domain-containing protein [Chelatococcus sambhunathii]|uniref:Parvulin-like PPIase n=1 Tax=Chelatococcus sambhunathii TaxID=363953 RepID=A0ABU1DFW8_9HYPH|nr:SurA N-terminal domain-containing protein [Chelatococcus sambhunathii]MDR4307005.1 SurA N-terminal domain-containing protein [Chelatococcus sambhunathii]